MFDEAGPSNYYELNEAGPSNYYSLDEALLKVVEEAEKKEMSLLPPPTPPVVPVSTKTTTNALQHAIGKKYKALQTKASNVKRKYHIRTEHAKKRYKQKKKSVESMLDQWMLDKFGEPDLSLNDPARPPPPQSVEDPFLLPDGMNPLYVMSNPVYDNIFIQSGVDMDLLNVIWRYPSRDPNKFAEVPDYIISEEQWNTASIIPDSSYKREKVIRLG